MKHPHAELMKLYAEDAMTSETPWKLWEYRQPNGNWSQCAVNPSWVEHIYYRRNVLKKQVLIKAWYIPSIGYVVFSEKVDPSSHAIRVPEKDFYIEVEE